MDFNLNDVGVTFLVGAFSILSGDVISFFLFGRHLTQISQQTLGLVPTQGPTAVLTTGVFVGLSFALGLLVEDACYKFHDPLVYRPLSALYVLTHPDSTAGRSHDLKADIERSVLFEKVKPVSPARKPLGDQVCRARLFESAFGEDGDVVGAWACRNGPLPPAPKGRSSYYRVDRAIRSSFYFAKNRVFTVESYYDELVKIQRRLEFSRTIATVTCVAAMIALVIWPVLLFLRRRDADERRRLVKSGGVLLCSFVAVYCLAYIAYIQESNEFVKRVFGYYAAMLHAAASHLP